MASVRSNVFAGTHTRFGSSAPGSQAAGSTGGGGNDGEGNDPNGRAGKPGRAHEKKRTRNVPLTLAQLRELEQQLSKTEFSVVVPPRAHPDARSYHSPSNSGSNYSDGAGFSDPSRGGSPMAVDSPALSPVRASPLPEDRQRWGFLEGYEFNPNVRNPSLNTSRPY